MTLPHNSWVEFLWCCESYFCHRKPSTFESLIFLWRTATSYEPWRETHRLGMKLNSHSGQQSSNIHNSPSMRLPYSTDTLCLNSMFAVVRTMSNATNKPTLTAIIFRSFSFSWQIETEIRYLICEHCGLHAYSHSYQIYVQW